MFVCLFVFLSFFHATKKDMAQRTTKQSVSKADAVVIIPILQHMGKQKSESSSPPSSVMDTILVEQFRPPVRQATIEFPAGLIDANETPAEAALRELREETGFVGEFCSKPPEVSRQVCMSPGMIDESVHAVLVYVDLDNPYNQDGARKQELDDGEFVKYRRVPLKDGLKQVLDQQQKKLTENNSDEEEESGEYHVPMPIMGLYLFAMGLEIGMSMK